ELSLAIGTSFNSQEIMQTIIKKSIRAIKAEQGAVIIVDSEGDKEMNTLVRPLNSGRGLLQAVCLKSPVVMRILREPVAQWKFSTRWRERHHSGSP
ncbi:hypothetical protein LCGC14_2792630, partial [marine sediment metagenome]